MSSWYKTVKNANKNQPSSIYNYSFHAILSIKKVRDTHKNCAIKTLL